MSTEPRLTVKTRLLSGESSLIEVGSETTLVMYCTGNPQTKDAWEAITLPPFTKWVLTELVEDEY
jgi:hypothetical protein